MRNVRPVEFRIFNRATLLVSAGAALMLAGCSSSIERFSQNNPSDTDPVYTSSVKQDPDVANARIAPRSRVAASPYRESNYVPKPVYSKPTYRTAATEVAASQGYQAPDYSNPKSLAQDTAESAVETRAPGVIGAARSGTVAVKPGMTLFSIARTTGIPVAQLAAANGLSAPYAVHTGQMIKIPGAGQAQAATPAALEETTEIAEVVPTKPGKGLRYKTPGASATAPAVVTETVKASSAPAGLHQVASGETLFSLGRKFGVSPYAIADLNNLPRTASLRVGQDVRIPGAKGSAAPARVAKAPAAGALTIAQKPAKTEDQMVASDDADTAEAPVPQPSQAASAQEAAAPAAASPAPVAEATGPSFRWPVRGKIISAYGPKPNGNKNEGINISVPEGTSVRSADGGVVAYSGNELKGYGNLVLVRHEGGWITAYAHNKELFVKRGDTIKRGDVIAKSGQSGSVTSPQLHFEVRKGAVAMDPVQFLGSSTASN